MQLCRKSFHPDPLARFLADALLSLHHSIIQRSCIILLLYLEGGLCFSIFVKYFVHRKSDCSSIWFGFKSQFYYNCCNKSSHQIKENSNTKYWFFECCLYYYLVKCIFHHRKTTKRNSWSIRKGNLVVVIRDALKLTSLLSLRGNDCHDVVFNEAHIYSPFNLEVTT